MKVITHSIGRLTLHQVVEMEIGPEVQTIFDGLGPASLRSHGWLFSSWVTPEGDLLALSQSIVLVIGPRIVLVDTCIGNDKPRPDLPRWSHLQTRFLEGLAAVGIKVEDVTDVLCTHLHADHVGWNTRWIDDAWRPTFPNARHYFARREYEDVLARLSEGPNLQTMSFEDSVRPIIEAGQAVVVDDHADLGDGISLVPTPGHTAGHVSISVVTGDRRLLISGDAIHHPLQLAMPDWSTTIDQDQEAARHSRRSLLSDASAPDALLVGTHFAEPSVGRVRSDGADGYRFDGLGTRLRSAH